MLNVLAVTIAFLGLYKVAYKRRPPPPYDRDGLLMLAHEMEDKLQFLAREHPWQLMGFFSVIGRRYEHLRERTALCSMLVVEEENYVFMILQFFPHFADIKFKTITLQDAFQDLICELHKCV